MHDDDLRWVRDRIEIQDLITQYWQCVDRREWDRVKAVFVPGALVDYSDVLPVGDAVPAEEIVDRIAAAIEIYATTVHNQGNLEVHLDGDTARAETTVVAHHVYLDPERQDGRLPVAGLRYTDEIVRTPDGWRIAHRRTRTDWRAWWDRRGPTWVGDRHQ